jgi:error-prone DNA polymerase
VAYQTLYLKAHYPAEFYCALLNHQPLGFYPPEVLAGDARRHGVPILQPDANRSQAACSLEQACPEGQVAIRLGLGYVRGLGEAWQERIVERRGGKPYRDLVDFCRRTRLPRAVVENLIRAGALDDLGSASVGDHSEVVPGDLRRTQQQMGDGLQTEPGSASVRDHSEVVPGDLRRTQGDNDRTRRDLLWELGGLVYHEEGLDIEVPVAPVVLPALGRAERLAWEYELMGMAPGEHLMVLYREALRAAGVLSSAQLAGRRNGERVRVAGWAVVRQRPPTAKGHLFITLEDEEGLANLIVRPSVYEQYRDVLRNAPLLWIEGRLQREGHAISVLVYRAAALGSPRI